MKKDQFLSHLSHERRAPLIVIYQFTAIVRDGIAGAVSRIVFSEQHIDRHNFSVYWRGSLTMPDQKPTAVFTTKTKRSRSNGLVMKQLACRL